VSASDHEVEQVMHWAFEEREAQAQKNHAVEITWQGALEAAAAAHLPGCDNRAWVRKWTPVAEGLLQHFER
jgi:hypothetical protein